LDCGSITDPLDFQTTFKAIRNPFNHIKNKGSTETMTLTSGTRFGSPFDVNGFSVLFHHNFRGKHTGEFTLGAFNYNLLTING
jgi:hypothetical protein